MICNYCEIKSLNQEMYLIRKETKPKGAPYRWKKVGYCCETCHEVHNKQIEFKLGESLPIQFFGPQ